MITGFTTDSSKLVFPDKVDGIQVTMVAKAAPENPGLSKIRTVTLPKGLKTVGYRAFENWVSLEKVTLPATLEAIGYAAFKGCKALRSMAIPDGVSRIGDEAFSYCGNLAVSRLPSGLETIGRETFFQCARVNKIQMPDSVRSIGEKAFAFCGVRPGSIPAKTEYTNWRSRKGLRRSRITRWRDWAP